MKGLISNYLNLWRRGGTASKVLFILIPICIIGTVCRSINQAEQPQPSPTVVAENPATDPPPTDPPSPTETPESESTNTPQPPATSTPKPTNTPVPATNTPEPTATPLPPTDTPEPTAEPTATSEINNADLETQIYLFEVGGRIGQLGEAMSQLGPLLQNAKIGDPDWTIQTVTQIVLIQNAHNELSALEPPANMADFHAALLDSTGDCNEAMDHLITGIDNLDIDEMNQATLLMLSCNSKIGEMTTKLLEATGQRPETLATTEPTAEPTQAVAVAPPPTNTSIPPTATPAALSKDDALNVQKQVGNWGMKLYNVKRAKAVYFFGEAEIAQGVWLLPFVEFTNLSTGTRAPYEDLDLSLVDEAGNSYPIGFSDGDLGAANQFQAGHIYDDIQPGLVLGIVMPVDVPEALGDTWIRIEQDPNFVIYLGNASSIPLE